MAVKVGNKSEQITIRVSETLKSQMLYYSLLDKKNLAEWVREILENEVEERKNGMKTMNQI